MHNYGAPQNRKRLLFLAVSKKIKNFNQFDIPLSVNQAKKM